MKMTAGLVADILDFWEEFETLTPFELSSEVTSPEPIAGLNAPHSSRFSWDKNNRLGFESFKNELARLPQNIDKSETIKVYTVCVGVSPISAFVRRASEAVAITHAGRPGRVQWDTRYLEQQLTGKICLAAFRINHFGKIVRGSFTPSNACGYFLRAKMIQTGQSIGLTPQEIAGQEILDFDEQCREQFAYSEEQIDSDPKAKEVYGVEVLPLKKKEGDSELKTTEAGKQLQLRDLKPSEKPITAEFIEKISDHLLEKSGLDSSGEVWVILDHQTRTRERYLDFMNSPYIGTLASLSQRMRKSHDLNALSPVLKQLFERVVAPAERHDVLSDPTSFYELADPMFFNRGRWPETIKHPLVACQQLAVSRICSVDPKLPLVSVNGPPGTGKTTILRELVAEVVVRRALKLAEFDDIRRAELFEKKFVTGMASSYVLRADLTDDYTIVAASSNNAAVENITKELPLQFSYEPDRQDYFGDLAEKLLDNHEAWGLISVPLGRTTNWIKVRKALFEKTGRQPSPFEKSTQDQIDLFGGLGAVVAAWSATRERFLALSGKVEARITELHKRYLKDARATSSALTHLLSGKAGLPEPGGLYFDFSQKENLDRHLESLYTDAEFDALRTELFLAALELHRLTILVHAPRFYEALKYALDWMGNDQFNKDPMRLMGTFSFLCPVISTTFAASPLRFGGYLKASLPWVVVDEASQATPQSVMCLAQRAKRLIVVGDPKQIEPVVPLPKIISDWIADGRADLEPWSPHNTSLQLLADAAQDFGAWLGEAPDGVWTGMPLRVQRRCWPPMFNISNDIAYDGQMVMGKEMRNAKAREDFIPSFWLNVTPAYPAESNAVGDEIAALDGLLRFIHSQLTAQALRGLVSEDSPKTVMICSPFRAVVAAVKKRLQGQTRQPLFKVMKIGTAHTMQGQQADIVILVLGSRTGNAGAGARRWACQPANLLNVSVTRARQTLIVIGNKADWDGFAPIAEMLYHLGLQGAGCVIDPQEAALGTLIE